MENDALCLSEVIGHAVKSNNINTILLHLDSQSQLSILSKIQAANLIVTTSEKDVFNSARELVDKTLFVVSKDISKIGELRHAILFATLAGLITKNEKVLCVTSTARSKPINMLALFDMSEEIQTLASYDIAKLVERVPLEVIESILHIAVELVEQGREGLFTGAMFVIGNPEELDKYCRQLIFNPFKGYTEEERSIVDFSIKETVKSFSLLDGAFIIKPDGIIVSAGTYLDVPSDNVELPPGLGTRHMAASAISAKTKAIAVVISRSGSIRIFKDGKIVLGLERR